MAGSGNYAISAFGSGNGSIAINGSRIQIDSLSERLYSVNMTVPFSAVIEIRTTGNISLSGIMIKPENIKFVTGAVSDFYINDFTGSGSVKVIGPGYLIFPYSIVIDGAKLVGKEPSGFYVYLLSKSGIDSFHFPNYLTLNLSTILIILVMYPITVFLYFPKSRDIIRRLRKFRLKIQGRFDLLMAGKGGQ